MTPRQKFMAQRIHELRQKQEREAEKPRWQNILKEWEYREIGILKENGIEI